MVRVLFVPVIAGISYEFIRLAGNSDSKFIGFLSKPGLWLQGLTTREPDDDMIRVAVASVEAVFDWQAYLDENFEKKLRKKNGKIIKAPAGKTEPVKETKKAVKKTELQKEEVHAKEEPVTEVQAVVAPVPEKKAAKAVSEVAITEEKVSQKNESEDITAKFDWSFPSAKKETKKDEPDEAAAKESRSRLAEKVAAADKAEKAGKAAQKAVVNTRNAEDEEEEDDILRALDKFFVFEGEGTVMERSGDKEH